MMNVHQALFMPLIKTVPGTLHSTSYSIAHVDLLVECDDESLGKRVIHALDSHFFLKKNMSGAEYHVTLKFKKDIPPFELLGDVRELFVSSNLRVFKNGTSCYLAGERVFLKLELADCQGTGYLDDAFWDRPPKSMQELFMLSLLWLFRKHGLYGVHGNALERNGRGILIAGDSGSGKSTTAISLIKQGWNYLSDDVTLLKQDSGVVKALAFVRGFSFDPHLAGSYPELDASSNSSWNGQKRFIDIEAVYPGRSLQDCIPEMLLFPEIVPDDKSRLAPLSRTNALIALMQNSGGIMVDREMAEQHIELLKQLLHQAECYQLFAGHDLHLHPEKISSMLPKA